MIQICVFLLIAYNSPIRFSRRKVVTRPHRLVVVAGAPNRFQKLQTTVEMKVRNVLPHEHFKRKGAHDIALLRLVHHFPDDNDLVKIIGLTNKMVKPGTSCQIIGWGQLFFVSTRMHSLFVNKQLIIFLLFYTNSVVRIQHMLLLPI